MIHFYLPKGYKLIRKSETLIEFKSKFHYWLLLQNPRDPQTYVIYHKRRPSDDYHRQCLDPLDLQLAIHTIKGHDAYFEQRLLK